VTVTARNTLFDSFRLTPNKNKKSGVIRRATQNKTPNVPGTTNVPRQTIPIDMKFIDTAAAGYNCDTTGSITLLNGTATGTDYTNRIGRRIRNIRVDLTGHFLPQSTTQVGNYARVMLVLDHQPNGAIPAITDILATSSSLTQVNVANSRRFAILLDYCMGLGAVSNTATQAYSIAPGMTMLNQSKQLGFLSEYLTTGATIAGMSTNALLLLTIGSNASGAGHNYNSYIRVYFDG
jgi:hypothetical protein